MSNNFEDNKFNKIISLILKNTRNIYILYAIYFVIMALYDIIKYDRPKTDIIITYISVAFIGVFAWFGIRFVFWLQIKNKLCSNRVLNVFTIVAVIIFSLASVFLGIQYFIDGFLVMAYIAPIALLSVLSVQRLRK